MSNTAAAVIQLQANASAYAEATNTAWKAIVFTQGPTTPCGITSGIPETLPRLYASAEQAQAAALAAMAARPELYCSTVRRVETGGRA